jgi:hydroxymethylglutaryl-CoA reductase (NADPH)
MKIPGAILRQLYTRGSLENGPAGIRFALKNRLMDATLTAVERVAIDDRDVPLEQLTLDLGDGDRRHAVEVSDGEPLAFPLRQTVNIHAGPGSLGQGMHRIEIVVRTRPFGKLAIRVEDAVGEKAKTGPRRLAVPCRKDDNLAADVILERQQFVRDYSGIDFQHLDKYSFDPATLDGNIENFTGVAQVPIGFAGPLRVRGEHADGEFLVPLATTEGTLVASYNRGIKVLNLSGGVRCTVVDDAMQRAPVFVFDSAREARDFVAWLSEHHEAIREEAEATSKVARLSSIEPYLASKFAFLRFNFTTGDAAGQNMVGRATFVACGYIIDHAPGIRRFYLESNMASDKKSSAINLLRTRGKRVTAEATISRDVLAQHLRVAPESLLDHHRVGSVGTFLTGADNNGAHAANAIAAMFIATGQDVASVAESSSAILYTEPAGDGFYVSLTIPSLIVATHGGGTGLATQRECLEIMGCRGPGKVRKLAEIIAGVALAGELSLGAAISSQDWVASHERYGRNRE